MKAFSDLRNSRELKSDQCGIETLVEFYDKERVLGSNRTNVGLKLLMRSSARYWWYSSNRTNVGLKLVEKPPPRRAGRGSNRTNVGLKLGGGGRVWVCEESSNRTNVGLKHPTPVPRGPPTHPLKSDQCGIETAGGGWVSWGEAALKSDQCGIETVVVHP